MDEDDDEDMAEKSDESEATVEATEEVSKSDDVAAGMAELQSSITSAFSDLTAVVKSLNEEIADLKKSLTTAHAKLEDAEAGFKELGKRVDAVETDTAFRKSGDLGEIVQETQMEKSEQSPWGGRFLKTADLFR
jgi:septal ring factor EnvC (AmiA/AmiB activator)